PSLQRAAQGTHVVVAQVQQDVREAERLRVRVTRLVQERRRERVEAVGARDVHVRAVAQDHDDLVAEGAKLARDGDDAPDVPQAAAELPRAEHASHARSGEESGGRGREAAPGIYEQLDAPPVMLNGRQPVPARSTDTGLFTALLFTMKCSWRSPKPSGMNWTSAKH